MDQIYLVLTETCNLACNHCIRESSPHIKNSINYEELTSLLCDIERHYPQATVLLTGGEPTVYKYFSEVLSLALDKGLEVLVNTNAVTSFFKESKLARFVKYKKLRFQISLDGAEEPHNKIRGEGTFAKSLDSLHLLTSMGFKCSVSATVQNSDFINNFPVFFESLCELDLTHIAIKRATYAGRAASGYELTSTQWNDFVYSVRDSITNHKMLIYPMYDFSELDKISADDLSSFADTNIKYRNCGAGTARVYVYPNLDVCSCTCFKSKPIGSLSTGSLSSIINSYSPLSVESSVCSNCRYLKLCNGGCLGSGYQYFGKINFPDPRCPKIIASNEGGENSKSLILKI